MEEILTFHGQVGVEKKVSTDSTADASRLSRLQEWFVPLCYLANKQRFVICQHSCDSI